MRYLKRSNKLYLDSYDLDHIFSSIKYQNATKEEVFDNFSFELMSVSNYPRDYLKKEIKIPKHKKYELTPFEFENFDELCNFMIKYRNNKHIIPYYGEDL